MFSAVFSVPGSGRLSSIALAAVRFAGEAIPVKTATCCVSSFGEIDRIGLRQVFGDILCRSFGFLRFSHVDDITSGKSFPMFADFVDWPKRSAGQKMVVRIAFLGLF